MVIYWIGIHLGLHYEIANAVGFVVTVALAYILNNTLTFNDNSRRKIQWSFKALMKTYAAYVLTGLLMASGLLWLWTEVIGIDENIAPLLNLFFSIPLNFLLNKFWFYNGTNS